MFTNGHGLQVRQPVAPGNLSDYGRTGMIADGARIATVKHHEYDLEQPKTSEKESRLRGDTLCRGMVCIPYCHAREGVWQA